MLTENQKKILENKIYNLIKESLFEKGQEGSNDNAATTNSKRASVMRRLKDPNIKKSQVAYELWSKEGADEDEKGAARSLFTKKVNGEDPDGNPYAFTNSEINTLYNIVGSNR